MNSLGLYIHIPWCIKKCPYCDFNSHALKSDIPEQQYVKALLNDLQQDLQLLNDSNTLSSIFIGGGTPSLFSAAAIEKLLNGIAQQIPFQDKLEITLEANPSTLESHKFADFRAMGINRLSMGIQSFNNRHLSSLGRIHSAEEALTAIDIAHQVGFENLNLDLMFGLPHQTHAEMLNDVQTAIDNQPSHISFYQLTLEPNTYFHKFPPQLPEDDMIFSAQQESQQLLAEEGFIQYEISAYAKNNANCQHNLNYWKFGDYLGIGAGAHGKLTLSLPDKIIRSVKPKNPADYLKDNRGTVFVVSKNELPLEFLMNQLRLKTGFNLNQYQMKTGLSTDKLAVLLKSSVTQGLLIKQDNHYSCSQKGWHFIDDILEKFVV